MFMKKFTLVLMVVLCAPFAHGSKLSHFLNKMEAKDKARAEQERRQDMNFNDLSFRLQRRFTEFGQQCRDYEFRSRSNPYRHGHYTVCDERGERHVHGHAHRHVHGHY